MSHASTEETLLDEGKRPLAFAVWWLVWFLFVVVVVVWFGVACVLFPSSCCVSFPFNDDLGTPPTYGVRTRGKKHWGLSNCSHLSKALPGQRYLAMCCAFPFFTNCSKLRATCKSTPSNVKQGWWDADFLQRGAFEKGFLFNDS